MLESLKSIEQVRGGIILLGQSRKEKDPLIWIKQIPLDQNIYITDKRFLPEVEFFKELPNSFSIRIECDELIRARRRALSHQNHVSEAGLRDYKGWDYVIDGNGDLKSVEHQVKAILKEKNICQDL